MSNSKTLQFNLTNDEYLTLQSLAQTEGCTSTTLAQQIIRDHLGDKMGKEHITTCEKRKDPRIEVSIPAVSLVNFTDNTSRSYPVTIHDISKGGVRIGFAEAKNYLFSNLDKAIDFEIVFTVPHSDTTVAFSCKVRRMKVSDGIMLGGQFEEASTFGKTVLNKLFN